MGLQESEQRAHVTASVCSGQCEARASAESEGTGGLKHLSREGKPSITVREARGSDRESCAALGPQL